MKIKRLLLTFGLAAIVGIGAFAGLNAKRSVKEAEASVIANTKMRLYINKTFGGTPYVGPAFGPANQPLAVQSIAADAENHIPASGTSVVASHTDVQDMTVNANGQSGIYLTFFENTDRWVPWRSGQSRQSTDGFNNALGQNDAFSVNFNNGYIYKIDSINGSTPYDYGCWSDGKDTYDENASRKVKWYTYSLTTEGVFVHYDLDGGSFSDESSADIEHAINTDLTLPAAPTKDGYTFMGWEASTNGILNRASTAFRITQPMTFTAIWHSNTLEAVDGNKARIWVGYEGNESISSLLYHGYGTEIKLWIHQGNNSAGTEQEIIAATGTYYNNAEDINSTYKSCPRRYDYFDVPLRYFASCYYLSLQRFVGGECNATVPQIQLANDATWAFKVLYAKISWETAPALSGLAENKTDALFASIALCGIHTCSNNVLNGYAGYSAWNATFLQNVEPSALAAYTINDFANGDTAYAGSKSKEVTAKAKYDAVLAAQGGDGTSTFMLNETNNSGMVIFAIIAVLSIASLALFFLIRKNRKQREE